MGGVLRCSLSPSGLPLIVFGKIAQDIGARGALFQRVRHLARVMGARLSPRGKASTEAFDLT